MYYFLRIGHFVFYLEIQVYAKVTEVFYLTPLNAEYISPASEIN